MDLLALYASSDSDEEAGAAPPKKAKPDSGDGAARAGMALFGSAVGAMDDAGRVRAFPHVPGNWPAIVYIPLAGCGGVKRACRASSAVVASLLPDVSVECLWTAGTLAPHISLSRPFVLRAHHIQPFVDALTQAVKAHRCFIADVAETYVFVNDDASATFVGGAVTAGKANVISLIRAVDKVLLSFRGEAFYEDPVPHISYCRVPGDQRRALCTDAPAPTLRCFPAPWLAPQSALPPPPPTRASLALAPRAPPSAACTKSVTAEGGSDSDSDGGSDEEDGPVIDVTQVCCKAGNKVFKIPLPPP